MEIKHFQIEEWMNKYEDDAVYNMAETCVDSLTLGELLALGGEEPDQFFKNISNIKLTYGHIEGSPSFRKKVSDLYSTVKPENILAMNGAIGANFLLLYSLVKPEDEVICVNPTYQQLPSVCKSFGATVKLLNLREENRFFPDLEELTSLVSDKTKLIIINNPNNPSGAVMDEVMLNEIVSIAKSVDAYLLCDEVYRGLLQNPNLNVPSIVDLYEKGISTGSMSKALSLAGLRLGWVVASREIIRECAKHRDYTTISCSMMDDILAVHALDNYDKIMVRNLKIVRDNLAILDKWIQHEPHMNYVKPQGGTTAILTFDHDISSVDFCLGLYEKNGAFLAPGSCFDLEGTVRIGYACDSIVLKEGLQKVSAYIKDLNN